MISSEHKKSRWTVYIWTWCRKCLIFSAQFCCHIAKKSNLHAVMKNTKKNYVCRRTWYIFRSIFYILVEKVSFLVLFIVQCIFSAKKSSYNVNIGNKKHQSWFINDKIIPKENPAKKFAVQKISLMHAMLIQF